MTENPNYIEIKKTPLIVTIIFNFITVGIYYPTWFLTRRAAINSLHSKEKLSKNVFIFGIVMFSIPLFEAIITGLVEGFAEGLSIPILSSYAGKITAIQNNIIDPIIYFIAGVVLLVQCFRVRSIFNDHFNIHLQKNIHFSGIALFFFQIFYLQYKINKFEYNKQA